MYMLSKPRTAVTMPHFRVGSTIPVKEKENVWPLRHLRPMPPRVLNAPCLTERRTQRIFFGLVALAWVPLCFLGVGYYITVERDDTAHCFINFFCDHERLDVVW